uniref:Uncharacterized protein n=1 Tax=Arundo donax TaxID=35708 RepID=A0A0A8YX79_ARUDO
MIISHDPIKSCSIQNYLSPLRHNLVLPCQAQGLDDLEPWWQVEEIACTGKQDKEVP